MGFRLFLSLLVIFPVLFANRGVSAEEQSGFIRPCFYTDWVQYRQGRAKFEPGDYVPGLCTHIVYAHAIFKEDYTVKNRHDEDYLLYRRVNALKKNDPQLKTLISIGGYGFGTIMFKKMVETEQTRKKFIDSAIKFARHWRFDGIDISWEHPSGLDEMARFAALINELREAFNEEAKSSGKSRLLVTAVVGALESTINRAYDVFEFADSIDFIHLKTYDFFGSWGSKIGYNSPLHQYQISSEYANFNIEWAANFWFKNGMPKEKIVIGMPTFGRSWTLNDANRANVGALGTAGHPTEFEQQAGFGGYYEICEILSSGATRHWDNEAKVPYLVKGNQWWTYDDKESFTIKMNWIKENKFGGAFAFALGYDDFNAKCSNSDGQPFPLISVIAKELGGIIIPKKN